MAAADVQSDPFVHAITVQWADCDPARIAYTGQIPKFALSAIDAWWAKRVGIDWFALNVDHRMGTPFVHLDMDFRSPITPRHPLFCSVTLTRLGKTSLTFTVVGRQNDTVCFEGNFVCVAVSAEDFRPGYPSADIRAKLEGLVQAVD